MWYTIMTLSGIDTCLSLDKKGNKYVVILSKKEESGETEHFCKTYDTIDEAMERFMIGANLIGRCLGTYENKKYVIFGE